MDTSYLFFLSSFCMYNVITNSNAFEPKDCVLSHWSSWSKCSRNCSEGISTRSRNIKQKPVGVFSQPCGNVTDSRKCGSQNNRCEHLCDEKTGSCHCKSGFILSSDRRTCSNINECFLNGGLGSCSQSCSDTIGSYKCSCHNAFILAADGHGCIYNDSIVCLKNLQKESSIPNKKCVCMNNLDGVKCDRNLSLCSLKDDCQQKDELCQTFIHANTKCLNSDYHIPILLKKMTYSEYGTGQIKYQVENYVVDILESRAQGMSLTNLRSDISRLTLTNSNFYVETLNYIQVKSAFTYVKFAVTDMNDNFNNLKMDAICPLIQSLDIQCITQEDCDVLKEDGIKCPSITNYVSEVSNFQKSRNNHKIKSWVYILISGFVIIILLLLVLLFMYLKRGKHSKDPSATYNNNHNISIFNTEYNTLPQRDTIVSWNHDPYPDNSTYIGAGNQLYDKDNDSLYKSDGQIPIYESIDNLRSCVEKEESTLAKNMEEDSSDIISGKSKDIPKGPCDKLVVELTDDKEERYVSLQSTKNNDVSCSKTVVDVSVEGEPHYLSPPERR